MKINHLLTYLLTNASIVSSGVVTVLSPNRVLLENQYFYSGTFTFHHISFSSILISSFFHVSPGLFSSNRWPFFPITGPPFYCRRRSRLNLSMLLLLIIGGVEVNPGPSPSNNLTFGMLNIRSVVNKAPLLAILFPASARARLILQKSNYTKSNIFIFFVSTEAWFCAKPVNRLRWIGSDGSV